MALDDPRMPNQLLRFHTARAPIGLKGTYCADASLNPCCSLTDAAEEIDSYVPWVGLVHNFVMEDVWPRMLSSFALAAESDSE
jgi:hypothetical protein